MSTDTFVTTDWLQTRLGDPNLAIIDGSWYLPAAGRDPKQEFLAGHIPGAIYFDIDAVADRSTDLPHMLLGPEEFGRQVGALGIGDGMSIVVYDEAGLFSAPRVWWEFITMGAPDVRILDGGGRKWRAEGRPLESGEAAPTPRTFTPRFHPELVRGFDQVQEALAAGQQVADARPAGRFAGREPEPRPNLKSGHMPGAFSLPSSDLVTDGRLKPAGELRAIFDEAGMALESPVITSCGSGVTAALLMLALRRAGAQDVAVYDGSWAEWAARAEDEIVSEAGA
jgi:thiosulfate/3-mercaptopyruvate sulfurtransferase